MQKGILQKDIHWHKLHSKRIARRRRIRETHAHKAKTVDPRMFNLVEFLKRKPAIQTKPVMIEVKKSLFMRIVERLIKLFKNHGKNL